MLIGLLICLAGGWAVAAYAAPALDVLANAIVPIASIVGLGAIAIELLRADRRVRRNPASESPR
jgi:hypothetical protein